MPIGLMGFVPQPDLVPEAGIDTARPRFRQAVHLNLRPPGFATLSPGYVSRHLIRLCLARR